MKIIKDELINEVKRNIKYEAEYNMDSIVSFGKYNGQTVKEIWEKNPKYIIWAIGNIDKFKLSNEALQVVKL